MSLMQLGQKVELPANPEAAQIECIHWVDGPIFCRFTCPEFTSLCPITGQPDFARIVIDYVPRGFLIESKSIKLFLGSFRNHGAFHEKVTVEIGKRLFDAADPEWMQVSAFFLPRGGIPIDTFWTGGELVSSVFVPPIDLVEYRGR
jgi:7-cyano-7-deazaguanine reductase